MKKYIEYIIVIGCIAGIVALGFHFWNPIKDLLHIGGISNPVRVEDSEQYKQLEKEKQDAVVKTAYLQGKYDQLMSDYRDEMNKLPVVRQNYTKSVKKIQNMKPAEIDAEYQREVKQLREEISIESTDNGTHY